MAAIGTYTVTLMTVDRDETGYKTSAHTVSHTEKVDLRRTLPKSPENPLRTQVRWEKGFPVGGTTVEKPASVSIAVVVPPGVVTADVQTWIASVLTQSATAAAGVGVTGDIHLDT